jgi:hypothetical protein
MCVLKFTFGDLKFQNTQIYCCASFIFIVLKPFINSFFEKFYETLYIYIYMEN